MIFMSLLQKNLILLLATIVYVASIVWIHYLCILNYWCFGRYCGPDGVSCKR